MHRIRISLRVRQVRWKAYKKLCDRLIKHVYECEPCQQDKQCFTWDELHGVFLVAQAQTKIMDYDKP